jgi:hypothetical protein
MIGSASVVAANAITLPLAVYILWVKIRSAEGEG